MIHIAGDMKMDLARRPSSIHINFLPSPPTEAHTFSSRSLSLQFTLNSLVLTRRSMVDDDLDFDAEKRGSGRIVVALLLYVSD